MAVKEIDCRNLACPQPVLNTKAALEQGGSDQLVVIVDNSAAVGNVTRFAESQGCSVDVAEGDGVFRLALTRVGPSGGPEPEIVCDVPAPSGGAWVVKVSDQFMGSGADELGRILMKGFIKTLADAPKLPDTMVFYNSGVKLTVEDSEHIPDLKALADRGVKIFSCGTCLDFFNIKDRLAVGSVTNMYEIIDILASADRVVSP